MNGEVAAPAGEAVSSCTQRARHHERRPTARSQKFSTPRQLGLAVLADETGLDLGDHPAMICGASGPQ